MDKQKNFAEIYEAYKADGDKVIVIEGVEYFKVIQKKKVNVYEIIALPNEVFYTKGDVLIDELGNKFTVGSPVHFSFKGEIPEWYLKTVSVVIRDMSIKDIGDYVSLVQST